MKHRKCKVCLPFLSHPIPDGCRSNCFTFLTGGYAFIRLVGVMQLHFKGSSSPKKVSRGKKHVQEIKVSAEWSISLKKNF